MFLKSNSPAPHGSMREAPHGDRMHHHASNESEGQHRSTGSSRLLSRPKKDFSDHLSQSSQITWHEEASCACLILHQFLHLTLSHCRTFEVLKTVVCCLLRAPFSSGHGSSDWWTIIGVTCWSIGPCWCREAIGERL